MPRIRDLGVAATVVCALLASPAAAQDGGLRIVVLEGEDGVNIIEQGTAVPAVVEVRDRNDLPVSGASVLFLLGEGGTATLNAGVSQVALTTNALGQAAVTVNPVASGAVQLSVNATFQGQTAAAAIVQTNFATVAEAAAAGVSATGGAGAGAGGAGGGGAGGAAGGTGAGGAGAAAGTGVAVGGGLGAGAIVGIAGAAAGAAVGAGVAAGGDDPDGADDPAGAPKSDSSGDPRDRAVLVEFYNATDGPNWGNNTNWNTSAPLDQWHGVSVDANGRVTELALGDNGLRGSLPSSLGSLTNLERLWLRGNQLSGSIPSSLGGLTNLEMLDLLDNQLSGSIPSSLGGLTNLVWLDLADNQLSGSIPSSLGGLTNLGFLFLSYNQLSGSIPSSLGGLTNLEDLWFLDNQLSGSIPSSLGGLTSLEGLYLSGNRLSGSIPSSLGGLTNLEGLYLSENQLSGSIPSSLGGLTNLEGLFLSRNQLSGSIPSSLGGLTNLEDLRLSYNQLSGSIPSSLGSLTNLRVLYLGDNQLSGSIPPSLGSLTNLEDWLLDNNQLSGSIPSSLGGLTNLTRLALSYNQLSGSIPSSLGGLTNLVFLGLDDNQLSGSIPSSLGGLTNLEDLRLSGNQLSGSIPSSLGGLTNLEDLTLWNNRLSGSIPAALCKFSDRINPQQDGVILPCAGSGAGVVEVRLVPGDGQLTVDWRPASDEGAAAVEDYDVRYRVDGEAGAWTELAGATKGKGTTATIGDLTNGTAYEVQVRAATAAGDGAWSAGATGTPVAAGGLSFGDARIEDQRWRQYAAIAPLVLPAATGGAGAVTYAVSPALPAGLAFDEASRTVSGAPSAAWAAATYEYTATDAAGATAGLSFTVEVEMSAEEAALRQDALAAQGRALLASVTGVIGERLRPPSGASDGGEPQSSKRALGEALASLLGLRAGRGFGPAAGGAGFLAGVGSAGQAAGFGGGTYELSAPASAAGPGGLSAPGSATALGRLSGPGSGRVPGGRARFGPFGEPDGRGLAALGSGGFGGGLPSLGRGASGFGGGIWDGLSGQSFSAPVSVGAGGGESSRYTVWGAGDVQSFSGSPEAGRYSGDVRSLYVGADGRLGSDWLAGAAVSRSWGSADYTAAVDGARPGRLTTRLTSVYPYVRGAVTRSLEVWAIGGYGRGSVADGREGAAAGTPGDLSMPGDLRMAMGAAGVRQDVAEAGGVALAVVGGMGTLSLSSSGGGLTVSGLGAGVHQGRVAVEASRASGAVSPFVQLGGRWDGGDGETGAGLELVGGVRASTARVDVEARGRWLSVHTGSEYSEHGAMARLAVKSRADGTGLRAALSPRWGMANELSLGEGGLLGTAGVSHLGRGGAVAASGRRPALSLEGEAGYGWRARRLGGIVSPLASYRRMEFGGELTQVGLSYESSEALRGDVLMQFTLGREQWLDRGAGYQWAVAVLSTF